MGYDLRDVLIQFVPMILLVCIQLFLSTRKNKWLGIIPVFLVTLTAVYDTYKIGEVSGVYGGLTAFAGCLHKIILLVAIHAACRYKKRKKNPLDKMNVQDLE